MEVTYTTTLDDYVALCMHLTKQSSFMKRQVSLLWLLLPLGLLISAALLASSSPVGAAILIVVGVTYAVIFPGIRRANLSSGFRTFAQELGTRGVISRITLVLTEDTLTERTDSVVSVVHWQDMKGVKEVGESLYIYVTGMSFAIIPRHGFEREKDYEAAREFVLSKLKKLV
ncbi:YcxB family protein [Gemmata sp. G18]|uniref:YcxB family protein n=1 Tax=Gemmata palustris TaxID=2822762 RepID=A0ABS5BT71_9BACT|nr:YcxB family protein [Gemmata palustris]MBP3956903.1 YcxB family protein [Gemmata palustris]